MLREIDFLLFLLLNEFANGFKSFALVETSYSYKRLNSFATTYINRIVLKSYCLLHYCFVRDFIRPLNFTLLQNVSESVRTGHFLDRTAEQFSCCRTVARTSSIGGLHVCVRGFDIQTFDKTPLNIIFYISIWGAWNLVLGAKSTKALP